MAAKKRSSSLQIIPGAVIERRIFFIRGNKVMLDRHLAELYRVRTIALRQAVKRNARRFPEDFVFQLSLEEAEILVSQNVIPSRRSFGGGFLPYAFTEQGVSMLSSVLRSERAIAVNIEIMRTFVRLGKILRSHKELAERLLAMEKKYDKSFKIVFDALRQLMSAPVQPKRQIGFIPSK